MRRAEAGSAILFGLLLGGLRNVDALEAAILAIVCGIFVASLSMLFEIRSGQR